MKKLTFVAAMAIAAATFTSCGNSTPKADLKTDVDTLSYAMGMVQSQGLKDYLVGRMGIDTTYMDQPAMTRVRQPIMPVSRLVSRWQTRW